MLWASRHVIGKYATVHKTVLLASLHKFQTGCDLQAVQYMTAVHIYKHVTRAPILFSDSVVGNAKQSLCTEIPTSEFTMW